MPKGFAGAAGVEVCCDACANGFADDEPLCWPKLPNADDVAGLAPNAPNPPLDPADGVAVPKAGFGVDAAPKADAPNAGAGDAAAPNVEV